MTIPPFTKQVPLRQKWFVEIGVKELDWSAQSPDLNCIKHLWDELERRQRARPNRPTSVLDLTNALVESLHRRGCYSGKGGSTPYPSFWNEMFDE